MANNINGASPSVNIEVRDFTFLNGTPQPNQTTLGIVGETLKGKAFEPMFVDTYSTFQQCFGGLDPCKYPDTNQLKYEAPYIAKQYLKESGSLFVTRVLGLSGYNAGDAWGITIGASLDLTSVEVASNDSFSVEVEFNNGVLNTVEFNRSDLQELYDAGKFVDDVFGSSLATTGDTINSSNVFEGNCDGTFFGANFEATAITKEEKSICITGSTQTSTTTTVVQTEQTCVVNYGAGTITNDSSFIVDIVNAIVLINTSNNALYPIENGLLQIDGGTITHNVDGSIDISNSNIFLPSGEVFMQGNYRLCSLEGNDAYYDCNTISGVGYTLTSGTTSIIIPVINSSTNIITTEIPTGIVTLTYNGFYNKLTGTSNSDLDDTLILTLRSKGYYDGNELLSFQVEGNSLSITPINGLKINPTDDFLLSGTLTNGKTFNYEVSLDRDKKSYIGRVFGSGSIQCCDLDTPFYIEENYIVMLEDMIANGQVDCIKPSICYNNDISDYKTDYKNAITPWIVSELRGNKVFRLFRFHTISDGNAANEDVKISIENIRPDKKDFDVVIRSFYDTDKNPIILEKYSRVNLSITSNSYLGLAIGTTDGKYSLNSKYVMVDIPTECLDDSYPSGFEGYPVRDWDNCKFPKMSYKTNYTNTERTRNVYLGISDAVGIEQDFFDYKGIPMGTSSLEWSGRTSGFHMDVNADSASVEGSTFPVSFEVGDHSFKNELELTGTNYEQLYNRKFTFVPYGGFDGWDIHRKSRTNTDDYDSSGGKAILGVSVGNFESMAINSRVTGISSDYYAYLKGIMAFDNPEDSKIDLIATAGINAIDHSDLVEATIDMIENDRCDAFYVFNMLEANSVGDAFTPNNMANLIEDLFDTPYAATYVHWGLYNDTENNVRVYLPPTAEVMRIMAKTDRVNAPWWAAAGLKRGKTEFTNIRKKLRQSDRDTLYDGRINSLYTDGGSSYVFGNKTLQIEESSLNQISLVRLVLYLRKVIHPLAMRLLFEPNDINVRSEFRRIVSPILRDIMEKRGISDFRVVLSNDPNDIDRGILNGSIFIKATPSLEEINLSFNLSPTGSNFDVN